MNRCIGEKGDFRRARCSTQDFALLISQEVFSFQSLRTPTTHGCHTSIDVRVNGYSMLWVQLQAEGGMQSNTDRSCLLIPFTSAPNTWQNRNQVLPHAGHADPLAIGVKKSVHFQLYRSTRPCQATPSRPSARTTTRRHYTLIEEACTLSLDNDNDTSRNDFSDNTIISFRLSIHKYFDSFRYRRACENSFRIRKCLHHRKQPRQSIKKKSQHRVQVGQKVGSHERERNWKGGDAVLSCSGTVYVESTLLYS